MTAATVSRIDAWTVAGLALLLLPLTTMWHEIGGHAATCAALGGRVTTIGAFYVQCTGLDGSPRLAVSLAGVAVDALLAVAAWMIWRRARGDLSRLVLWYVWVMKAQVAAGYFLFSGVTGFGDLGIGSHGGLGGIGLSPVWRLAEIAVGGAAYCFVVLAAIRGLNAMIGDRADAALDRRRIAHLFYAMLGATAVVVGLFNPVGLTITLMSAAASSFGGNAGFISIGYSRPGGSRAEAFAIPRSAPLIVAGVIVTMGFAAVLGPSLRF